jgi:hypothetical protein
MVSRHAISAAAFAMLLAWIGPAAAFEDAKYPDLSGQWLVVRPRVAGLGQFPFNPVKPWGKGQEAPLTPEYQAIHDASLADQANGGQGNWPSGERCMPAGMPAMMNGYGDLEVVVLPEVTHMLISHNYNVHRRIFTDGRDWPADIDPSYRGLSIGRWVDTQGNGNYDQLLVETRHLKGPRALDPTGLPMHVDNQSIIKERIYLDREEPGLMHDEVTLLDHAFTQPWTVLKTYRRSTGTNWIDENCPAVSRLVKIGKELYFKGAGDELLPTRTDQPPPDLRYFGQAQPGR